MNQQTIYYNKPSIPSSGKVDFCSCIFKQIQNNIISSSIQINFNDCVLTSCASNGNSIESFNQLLISKTCFFGCHSNSQLIKFDKPEGTFSLSNSDILSFSSNSILLSVVYGSQTVENLNISNSLNLNDQLVWLDNQDPEHYDWINMDSCRCYTLVYFDSPTDLSHYEAQHLNIIDNSVNDNGFIFNLNCVSALRNSVFQRNRYRIPLKCSNVRTVFYDTVVEDSGYSNIIILSSGSKISTNATQIEFQHYEKKCFSCSDFSQITQSRCLFWSLINSLTLSFAIVWV